MLHICAKLPICDEFANSEAFQKVQLLALPWERAHEDISNDTSQLVGEFQVRFSV